MPLVNYGDGFGSIANAQAIDISDKPLTAAVSDPSLLSTLGAAFRQDNIVASAISSETFGLDRYQRDEDQTFNPLTEIRGTKYEERAQDAASIFNRSYFDAWKTQVDREDEDRRTVEASGWVGTGASVAAALFDLPSLIPGGEFVGGLRTGAAAARSAGRVALAGGAGAALSEAGLQATQETRTASQSAVAIGSGVVFGGLLGGTAGALMSRAEQRAAVAAIDVHRQAAREGTALTPIADEVERIVAARGASAGAAATTTADIGDLSVAGRATAAYAETIAGLNPLLRALNSPSPVSRQVMLGMIDNPIYLKMNMEGETLGASVETVQKQWDRGAYSSGLQTQKSLYVEARAAGVNMAYSEFDAAVGQAARRGDQGDNEFVSKAAANWRSVLTDPLAKEAQEVGQLPKELTNRFGETYLHRIYNQRKIIQQRPQFREAVRPHITMAVDQAMATESRKLAKQAENLQREMDDLEMGLLRRRSDFEARTNGNEAELADGATESDVLSMIRQVQSGKAAPRPQTLLGWLHSKGLYDPGGELGALGINNRTRPGFVRRTRSTSWGPKQGGGLSLDDAANAAWEEGFFPGWTERPTVRDFLDALDDDFRGLRRVVREADIEAGAAAQRIADVEAALSRMGVDVRNPRFATDQDMRGFASKVNEALDGIDRQRIAALKAKHAEVKGSSDQAADAFATPEDKADYVEGIIEDTINKLTGADLADVPDGFVAKVQGPLKERTLKIPDRVLEPWLEDSMELVQKRYARKMGADVGLARRYGSADLKDQEIEIKASYQELREGVTDEKELLRLDKAQASDLNDMRFARDALRGNYDPKGNSSNFAKILKAAQTFNYMTAMGGVTVGSLTDIVRPAMVHGLTSYMRDGLIPLITNLKAVKLSVADAKHAGVIAERSLQARMATYAEVIDPYSRSSPFERFLENVAGKFTTLTGLNHFTDLGETIASVMTQSRVLRNAESGFGSIKGKEKAYMAYLGLDEDMTLRVAAEFKKHGDMLEGVRVANVDGWTDANARRAYLAAIAKDVHSTIVQKSIGDVPIWTNTPIGRAVVQFKSFALASNQRVLMRGMQEGPGRLMGGITAMATMGALIYWLKNMEAGREVSDNPGTWIAEGLDRSGILAIGFELNNMAEKTGGVGIYSMAATAGNALFPGSDMKPPASRYASRNIPSALAGPTFGMATDAISLIALTQKARSDLMGVTEGASDVAPSDIQTMRRLTPFASLPMWRWLIDGGFEGLGWQEATGFSGVVPELKEAVQ